MVTRRVVIGAWAILVLLFLSWQAVSYRGVIAVAAEWQFNLLGRYYPALTLIMLVVILGSPVWWLFRHEESRRERAARLRSARRNGRRMPSPAFVRALGWLASGFGLASIAAVILMLWLPTDSGGYARVVLGAPSAVTPEAGRAEVSGVALPGLMTGFDQSVLFARHSSRYLPLVSDRSERTIRYFVDVHDSAGTQLPVDLGLGTYRGMLRKGALPGEVVRLYRYAGYVVPDDSYVLFGGTPAMRWPFLVTAIQLAIVTVVLAICTVLLDRRERRRVAQRGRELAERVPSV